MPRVTRVVDEHADIAFVTARNPRLAVPGAERGVHPGHEPLRGRLLVAGGAVDLAGEEQVLHPAGLQPRPQLPRVEVVVLDGVSRARDVRALEARDGAHELDLHVEREARGDAVRVDLVGIESFRLDEDLVRVALGEPHHLVLHRRAVPRPRPVDHARVHGRPVERGADDLVGPLAGMGDMARHLCGMLVAAPEIGEHRPRIVAGLELEPGEIDGASVDARRRAGLQAPDRELALAHLARQRVRGRIAGTASFLILQSHVDASAEEGADSHHHAGGLDANPDAGHHPAHCVPLDDEVGDRLLEQREAGRAFEHAADVPAVERAVDLSAGRAHRGTLARVEGAKVDPAVVGGHRHRPAERVDLLDEVSLADPADGRIAAHLPEGLDALREQQRLRPGAGRGERRLGAGMAAADDDDVECTVVEHGGGRPLPGGAMVPGRIVAGFNLDAPLQSLPPTSAIPRDACRRIRTAGSEITGLGRGYTCPAPPGAARHFPESDDACNQIARRR